MHSSLVGIILIHLSKQNARCIFLNWFQIILYLFIVVTVVILTIVSVTAISDNLYPRGSNFNIIVVSIILKTLFYCSNVELTNEQTNAMFSVSEVLYCLFGLCRYCYELNIASRLISVNCHACSVSSRQNTVIMLRSAQLGLAVNCGSETDVICIHLAARKSPLFMRVVTCRQSLALLACPWTNSTDASWLKTTIYGSCVFPSFQLSWR
jgi:hypothetical protein